MVYLALFFSGRDSVVWLWTFHLSFARRWRNSRLLPTFATLGPFGSTRRKAHTAVTIATLRALHSRVTVIERPPMNHPIPPPARACQRVAGRLAALARLRTPRHGINPGQSTIPAARLQTQPLPLAVFRPGSLLNLSTCINTPAPFTPASPSCHGPFRNGARGLTLWSEEQP